MHRVFIQPIVFSFGLLLIFALITKISAAYLFNLSLVFSVMMLCGLTLYFAVPRLRKSRLILENEFLLHQIAAHTASIYLVFDPKTDKILFVSRNVEQFFKFNVDALLHNPRLMFQWVYPEDLPICQSALTKFEKCGTFCDEFRIFVPEDGLHWFRLRLSLIEQGLVLALCEDITEQKTQKLQLLQQVERLKTLRDQELVDFQNRVVDRVSHELRTPLTVINSSSELLERYADRLTVEKTREHLHRIREHTQQLNYLVNEIASLKIYRDQHVYFQPVETPLPEFTQKLVHTLQEHYHDHLIEFNYLGDTLATVAIDPNLFERIFTQLLSNAVRYSPKQARIAIELRLFSKHLVLSISDQGIGIPEIDLKHVFQPFYRGSNIGAIRGHGLGLTIVRDSLKLHGGTISIDSRLNQGTSIVVEIPLKAELVVN
ncbi:MAG: HAMP domain-containing histidine kinase [Anaerolineae bacterium]|nr:HAMP domain-containing histidine kinase [Anaerolineae bacterium]